MDRVRQACRVRHFSPRTEDVYPGWIRHFVAFHQMQHPDHLREPEVAAFLSSLTIKGNALSSTHGLVATLLDGAGPRLIE